MAPFYHRVKIFLIEFLKIFSDDPGSGYIGRAGGRMETLTKFIPDHRYIGRDLSYLVGGGLPCYALLYLFDRPDWADHVSLLQAIGFALVSYSVGVGLGGIGFFVDKTIHMPPGYTSISEFVNDINKRLHPALLRLYERNIFIAHVGASVGPGFIATSAVIVTHHILFKYEAPSLIQVTAMAAPMAVGIGLIAFGRMAMGIANTNTIELAKLAKALPDKVDK